MAHHAFEARCEGTIASTCKLKTRWDTGLSCEVRNLLESNSPNGPPVRLAFDPSEYLNECNPGRAHTLNVRRVRRIGEELATQFGRWCAIRGIDFDWYVKGTQYPVQGGPNYPPFETAVPGSKRRHSERGDAPLIVVLLEEVESLDNVG